MAKASIWRPRHAPHIQQVPPCGGKSLTAIRLATAFGGSPSNFNERTPRIDPNDPLGSFDNYTLKGRDKRFGNVVRYKTNNATLGLFHKEGEIGTTGVRGDKASNGVFVIAWVRKHGTERMKEAVACALLLHEHVAIIHAFEDEP